MFPTVDYAKLRIFNFSCYLRLITLQFRNGDLCGLDTLVRVSD